jgi:cysteinyl-tRNA synthetase
MELQLYDTMERKKRPFVPLEPERVGMYVCGPTVYDFAHIGNARPVIVFDVLFRLLRHLAKQGVWDGGKGETTVTYVRNITDVDDKINTRAAEEYPGLPLNEAIRIVTEKTERQFHEDVAALGCLTPTLEPRATEHIDAMKALIERLITSRHAYVAAEHVLFSVPSMPDYGRLCKQPLDEMLAGARVEVAPYKRDPMDFVLWKPSKPGEPAWPSPARIATPGRPGWHIECSAMSWQHLGKIFDIHGGGVDLVFPHHENEIAQSRCAFHTPVMANYWLHNGFLQVEGEKMAKSLGNFVTIRELLADWPGEVLRLNMLRTHYRQPIDWTYEGLKEAQQIMSDWQKRTAGVDLQSAKITPSDQVAGALLDDLNTPEALYFLHEIGRARGSPTGPRELSSQELYSNLVFLGLIGDQLKVAEDEAAKVEQRINIPPNADPKAIEPYRPMIERELEKAFYELPSGVSSTATSTAAFSIITLTHSKPAFVDAWTKYNPFFLSSRDGKYIRDSIGIESLNNRIERRLAARREKNFKEADRIRDEVHAMGIELEDHKDGTTTWKVKR